MDILKMGFQSLEILEKREKISILCYKNLLITTKLPRHKWGNLQIGPILYDTILMKYVPLSHPHSYLKDFIKSHKKLDFKSKREIIFT